jgi:hypothetical protein
LLKLLLDQVTQLEGLIGRLLLTAL